MKNASTIVFLALVGFVITLAVIIGSRLSDQQVALLAGLACGAGVAIPLGIVIGAFDAAQRQHGREAPPPIIYVTPPATSASNVPLLAARSTPPPSRSFNVIGDSGFDEQK
jgi:hypothetical protein